MWDGLKEREKGNNRMGTIYRGRRDNRKEVSWKIAVGYWVLAERRGWFSLRTG